VNSGSSKVVGFGNNQKRVRDFLLVINSNSGPILHRFGDTVVIIGRKIAKIASLYPPQSQKSPSLGVTLLNFAMSQTFLETRMFRLSDGEEIMTLAFFVLKPDGSQPLAGWLQTYIPTRTYIRWTRLSQPF